ncbi:MAG: type VI secretion system baseplate subunit TssG [Methylococcaceae bacterium]
MSPHDIALKALLAKSADSFDFFAAVRLIESWSSDKPRLATSAKASDEAIRFSQPPELGFQAASLAAFVENAGDGREQLAVNFMGLFGPHGALPLHLTEYARERLRHHQDPTFARFVDIFHHRMISLFYRAWANARPVVHYDRPETERFKFYTGALLGIGGTAFMAGDALNDHAKLFYAGHFAGQTKSPEGLRAILSDLLLMPVNIEEFIGEWMAIEPAEQTTIGLGAEFACLGQSALLGAQVWGCQHKFRIVLGAMTRAQYVSLLPGSKALAQLVAIVRNYIGDEMVWDAQLRLQNLEVPAELALGVPDCNPHSSMQGDAQLGWSTWLGPRQTTKDADDLRLNPYIQWHRA